MPDQIHTVHISPYIAAQGTADDLAAMGVQVDPPQPCDACRGWGTIRPARGCPCGCDDVDCSKCDGTGEKANG